MESKENFETAKSFCIVSLEAVHGTAVTIINALAKGVRSES